MGAFVELYIDQGTTFNNEISLVDDINGAAINVSNYVVKCPMRRSYYSKNVSANITCTITDASNGKITMSMTPSNTSNIKTGTYVFNIETTSPLGVVERPLEGLVYVTPRV